MKPEEFVARMVDVFTMDLGENFGVVRPTTFSSAAMCVAMCVAGNTDIVTNGYHWRIQTDQVLDHIVIKAAVSDGVTELVASVCFNTLRETDPVPLLATWHPSNANSPECPESRMNMLAMLTLKTNNRIKEVL